MRRKDPKDSGTPGSVFKVGAIALAFLIIGYQSALFVHRAAELRIASLRDRPDTVYVIDEALASLLLAPLSGTQNSEPCPERGSGGQTIFPRTTSSFCNSTRRILRKRFIC